MNTTGIVAFIVVVVLIYSASFTTFVEREEVFEPEEGIQVGKEMELLDVAAVDESAAVVPYYNFSGMHQLAAEFFKGTTCQSIWGRNVTLEQSTKQSTIVNISFGCYDLFKNGHYGTGNFISAFYGIRVAAHAIGMTDVIIQCDDAQEHKESLILPWMMGVFPRLPSDDSKIPEQPTVEDACKNFPIGWRWRDMLFELRRMAIAMVGIPSPEHPSAVWAEENLWANPRITHRHGSDIMQLPHPKKDDTPFYPGTQLDDAILHFRCGDIAFSNHPAFGFMKFGSFSRHLSPEVRTIGIVTQPFEADAQQRKAEGGRRIQERCRILVGAFVEHLQERFPNATISVHNSVNETISLTFARMIMANETVVGITSFGVFPGVSTFGTGYIRDPDYARAPNQWLLNSPILQHLENVKLIKEPGLLAPTFKNMWAGKNGSKGVLAWFQNYDMP